MYVAPYIMQNGRSMGELFKRVAAEVIATEPMNWNLSWEKFSSAFLTHREVSAQETVYPFRSQNENSHICELWPGKRPSWRHYLTHASSEVVGRHLDVYMSVGALMFLSSTLSKKQQCPDCVRHVINVSAGGTEAVRWSVKRAERKTATARVRGMNGVCRFGQNHACVGEICWKTPIGRKSRIRDWKS